MFQSPTNGHWRAEQRLATHIAPTVGKRAQGDLWAIERPSASDRERAAIGRREKEDRQ